MVLGYCVYDLNMLILSAFFFNGLYNYSVRTHTNCESFCIQQRVPCKTLLPSGNQKNYVKKTKGRTRTNSERNITSCP